MGADGAAGRQVTGHRGGGCSCCAVTAAGSSCIQRSIREKLLFSSLQGQARHCSLPRKFPGWQKWFKAKWIDLGVSTPCAPMETFLEEAQH